MASPLRSEIYVLRVCVICLFFLVEIQFFAQKKLSFNGYLAEMPSYTWFNVDGDKVSYLDNLIHNRINMSWTPSANLIFAGEIRTRLISGQNFKSVSGYAVSLDNDPGYFDMSFNPASSSEYALNTMIDRLWGEYTKGSFQVRLGRQRINWCQSLVWNPNDIFNAYSYFDFDYVEKPGIDGVRCQYYTGNASLVEGVAKVDWQSKKTVAVRYRFNSVGYDFQTLGGWFNDEECVLGVGWSGSLKGAGFYGECSWFVPMDGGKQSLISSIGANYTFQNSLYIQGEVLYSSNLKDPENFLMFYFGQSSVKNLSITDWTWLTSASYPITPLFNSSFSVMGFPAIHSYYFGPSFDYSVRSNLYLSIILQYFGGKPDGITSNSVFGFIRAKWNF